MPLIERHPGGSRASTFVAPYDTREQGFRNQPPPPPPYGVKWTVGSIFERSFTGFYSKFMRYFFV
jgi:hypothetical protein